MRSQILILLLFVLSSCYKTLELDDFDKNEWVSFKTTCTEYRLEKIDLLIENKEVLLESTQNGIESLLGAPEEHELYERNQKFFHYRLTPFDTCSTKSKPVRFLSIRFNAVGRANDIQVMFREDQ